MAMVSNVEPLDFWRLCDELSVVQAALLIVEVDPSKCMSYVEDWELEKRPAGYAAAKAAICGALQCKNVTGTIIPFYNDRFDGEYKIEGSLDPGKSRLQVGSLKTWLAKRGIKTGFFFPEGSESPDYLDWPRARRQANSLNFEPRVSTIKRNRARRVERASYSMFVGLITLTCLSTLMVAVGLSLSLI